MAEVERYNICDCSIILAYLFSGHLYITWCSVAVRGRQVYLDIFLYTKEAEKGVGWKEAWRLVRDSMLSKKQNALGLVLR